MALGMDKSGIATPVDPDINLPMVRAEHRPEYAWKDPASGKAMSHPGGELYKPDLVPQPIGGNFTINANRGALAVRDMTKPECALSMHCGTFPILAGKPEDFAKGLEGSGIRVVVPQPGDAVSF